MKTLLWFFVFCSVAVAADPGYTGAQPDFYSNGTQTGTQAAINAASDGATIHLPAGTYRWTSPITNNGKGLRLIGAGTPRVMAHSASVVSVAAGLKSFTLIPVRYQPGITTVNDYATFTVGKSFTAIKVGGFNTLGGAPYGYVRLQGTVDSYNSTTKVLVLNVLEAGITNIDFDGQPGPSPRSWASWILVPDADDAIHTTIENAYAYGPGGSLTKFIQWSEHASYHSEIAGLNIRSDRTVTQEGDGMYHIGMDHVTNGLPAYLHDVTFFVTSGGGGVWWTGRNGVMWNVSAYSDFFWPSAVRSFFVHEPDWDMASWTTVSTFGTNDVDGTSNFYVEDSDFHGVVYSCDLDNNARTVMRRNFFNHTGVGTHGADSSPYGMRFCEVYDCRFYYQKDLGTDSLNQNGGAVLLRGGTGVITRNEIDDVYPIGNYDYQEVQLYIYNLDDIHGQWSYNDGGVVHYPVPRQVGLGYIDGTGLDGLGRNQFGDPARFVGDPEPVYVWGNTGTVVVGVMGKYLPLMDDPADYIQTPRNWITTAKPGYTSYTYPHPLRPDSAPATLNTTTESGRTEKTRRSIIGTGRRREEE